MLTTERRPGQPAQGSIYFLHSPPHSEGSRNIAFRGQGGRKMPQGFDLLFHLRSGRSCARGTPQMVSTAHMSTSHGPGPWPGPRPRGMAQGHGPGARPLGRGSGSLSISGAIPPQTPKGPPRGAQNPDFFRKTSVRRPFYFDFLRKTLISFKENKKFLFS